MSRIYIACEEMDFTWDESDIRVIEGMWREGLEIGHIAQSFGRDPDEVALLIMDRARKGFIRNRKNGVYGQQMPREGIS